MGARHILVRLRALFRNEAVRREIHDEFEFHIEQRTADNIARGLSPEAARRAAERAFGRRVQLMDAAYDVRGGGWLETVSFDLRYAVRRLWSAPAFTIPAVLILVFGIGANTVLFTVLAAALFSRPPVPAPEEVVRVHVGKSVDFPTYAALAQASQPELNLAAYAQRPFSLRLAGSDAERVTGEAVTQNYFTALRVAAVEGHLWAPHGRLGDGVPVVLGEALARRLSPGSSLAGSGIWINGEAGIVVGILPASFTGSNPGFDATAWVPIQSLAALSSRLHDDGDRWLSMIGRLGQGVSIGQAQARLRSALPVNGRSAGDQLRVQPATGLVVAPDSRGPFLASVGAVTAVMIIVLLVSGASVGGLLLARSMASRGETALRLALGASRLRVAQQVLAETLLLSLLAGVTALLVGALAVSAVARMVPADYGFPVLEVRITAAAALFTMMAACAAGIVFGILPARRLWATDLRVHLRALAGSTPRRGRASMLLVVGQVAGAVVLLVTAGMFLYALHGAASKAPEMGQRVLIVPLALSENGYDAARAAQFTSEATARLLASPAVEAVTLAQFGRYSGSSNLRLIVPSSHAPFEVESNGVGPGYFRTLDLRMVAGRDFTPNEDSGTVIINVALAQRLQISPQEAVDATLRAGPDGPVLRVVGVVEDVENVRPGEGVRPFLYESLRQDAGGDIALHVRAAGAGSSVAPTVRAILRQLDPNLPLYRMRTLEEQMRAALAPSRAASAMTSLLGAVALLLAATGVYGITAFLIAARTREIGLRIALGASRAQIVALVGREGLLVTIAGIAAGFVLAYIATRILAPYIGSIASGLMPIGIATASLVCASTALAAWNPLRRGLAIDPVRALRAE